MCSLYSSGSGCMSEVSGSSSGWVLTLSGYSSESVGL